MTLMNFGPRPEGATITVGDLATAALQARLDELTAELDELGGELLAKDEEIEGLQGDLVRARRDAERRARDAAEGRDPVESVVVPADLPLEAIAEEVKNSWKLKEVHAETMLQRAMAKSEKPWLIALTLLSAASALLLAAVFWKLHDMG